MGKRYYKDEEDVNRRLAVDEINALTRQKQLAMEQEALAREQAFLQPTGLQQLAGPVQGFDVQYGSEAGGQAYYMPVDFGANVMTDDYFRGQGEAMMPQQVDPNMIDPLEDLEVVQGYTDVYYENVNKLNDMANKAAKMGFDVTKPDAFNPDQLALHRAYNDLKTGTLELGWQLKHGREDVKIGLNKGMLFEGHQGATVGSRDYTNPNMLDKDLVEANKMMKTYFDNNAFTKAEEYYDEVVAGWEQRATEAEARKDFKEAETFRRKILALNKPTMDRNKILDRNQRAEEAKHKKKGKLGNKEEIEDLFMEAWGIQNWGQEGLLSDYPGATINTVGGQRIVSYKNKNKETVEFPVSDWTSLMKFLVEGKGQWAGKISKEDFETYNELYGEWLPPDEDNFYIGLNVNELYNDYKKSITVDKGYLHDAFDDDVWANNETSNKFLEDISQLLSYGAVINIGNAIGKVTHAVPHDLKGGSIMVTLEDGTNHEISMEHGSSLIKAANKIPKYNFMSDTRGLTLSEDSSSFDPSDNVDKKVNKYLMKMKTKTHSRNASSDDEEEDSREEEPDVEEVELTPEQNIIIEKLRKEKEEKLRKEKEKKRN